MLTTGAIAAVRLAGGAAALALAFQISTQQACNPTPSPPPAPAPSPAPPGEVFTAADGTRFGVEVVATGLQIPWSLAFAPDGRLFVTERPGRVRVIQNGRLLPDSALVLADVSAQGEGGLLGVALSPLFAQNHLVYLVYTARRATGSPVNRVVRYREVNNTLAEAAVLVDGIGAATIHDGGRIRYGPDGLLYVTMGDAAVSSIAQDLASPNGKILRLEDDGRAPRGNPFGSLVYSYGHRNPQGLDWHPATGDLWATEHGATANDELNVVDAGRNYGWPLIEAARTLPGMQTPALFFDSTVAPSGGSFYRGAAFPSFRDNFFFATLRGLHVHRVVLDSSDPRRIVTHERLLEGRFGRIRDVVSGPDGALYFCTSNRDGRGTPVETDDRVARIVPVR